MIVGCYTLDLYCDAWRAGDGIHSVGEFPAVYIHERGAACRRMAKRDGWLLATDRQLCPKCSGKRTRTVIQMVQMKLEGT